MLDGIVAESVITCPHCGHAGRETMPADACQYLYDCKGCGRIVRPLDGDCCVFCSYGDTPCPPVQRQTGTVGCHAKRNRWVEQLMQVATDQGPPHARHARLIALAAAIDQAILASPAETHSRLRANLGELCNQQAEWLEDHGKANAAEIMSTAAKLLR